MPNALEQLKQFTVVVADTGDFDLLDKYKPQESTTNPSLLLAASQKESYSRLVEDAIAYGKEKGSTEDERVDKAMNKLAVNFGVEILKIVPGRVSTEIDARLSYDTEATVDKARELATLYREVGVDPEKRVLFKIASTWEGLQAARILEKENLHVNMTLMFSLTQAAVAADAGATLISPFVGRITDYYKAKENKTYEAAEDPGVKSVQTIYNYYKSHGYSTVVMGASFRTTGQILELAGCDLLTVNPTLLEELSHLDAPVTKKLSSETATTPYKEKLLLSEKEFRWRMCNDEMAHFKLAEGIRRFASDGNKLSAIIRQKMAA